MNNEKESRLSYLSLFINQRNSLGGEYIPLFLLYCKKYIVRHKSSRTFDLISDHKTSLAGVFRINVFQYTTFL